jgi:hypothetical protein
MLTRRREVMKFSRHACGLSTGELCPVQAAMAEIDVVGGS